MRTSSAPRQQLCENERRRAYPRRNGVLNLLMDRGDNDMAYESPATSVKANGVVMGEIAA